MKQIRLIERSYTVELPILSATNSKINFGDNETMLDNVEITAISLLPGYLGTSPTGKTLLPLLATQQVLLTLADADRKEYNKQMPLELFSRGDSIIHIVPKKISIRNSYVDIPLISTLVIPAGGYALAFVFFYNQKKLTMSFQLKRLGNSANVEVIIKNNTTTQFPFTDNNLMLDKVLIHGMYVPVLLTKSPLAYDMAPIDILRTALLTLAGYKGQQFNTRLPFTALGYNLTEGAFPADLFEVFYFKPRLVNLRQSYLEFPSIKNFVIPATYYSTVITFFYEKYNPAVHRLNDWDELITDQDDSIPELF